MTDHVVIQDKVNDIEADIEAKGATPVDENVVDIFLSDAENAESAVKPPGPQTT